jgi:hypothetical protein
MQRRALLLTGEVMFQGEMEIICGLLFVLHESRDQQGSILLFTVCELKVGFEITVLLYLRVV